MSPISVAPAPGARGETDFPAGHPGRSDYRPNSPEAIEWARIHVAPLGERDFPVDHPGAIDTPGHKNNLEWAAGVDPFNTHLEPHTGRTPEQVAGLRALSEYASTVAKESPAAMPLDALAVNAALDAKRRQVGRDILTETEYSEVVAAFHTGKTTAAASAEVKALIDRQWEAIDYLRERGYTQNAALEILGREGAEKILAERDARAAQSAAPAATPPATPPAAVTTGSATTTAPGTPAPAKPPESAWSKYWKR